MMSKQKTEMKRNRNHRKLLQNNKNRIRNKATELVLTKGT